VRVALIHNPGAGTQARGDIERMLDMVRAAGHEVRYQSCLDEHWAHALEEPCDLVAVVAGDGSVSRVARRMAGRATPVTVLPAGTANNIARALGLVERPWEELVRGWQGARRVKLDVGLAAGPWGERSFIEGVGAGLFAGTLPDADASRTLANLGRRDAKVAYALQMLKDRVDACTALPIKATLDGKDLSGEYLLLEALNIPYVGPNLFLAPDSAPGDGQFDVIMAGAEERERLGEYLAHWQDERERLAILPARQGRHLRIEWTGFPLHIDDELWPEPGSPPVQQSGTIDLRITASVEFLAPD
jgi:diacylglycerol kinase family enzyme